MVYYYALYVARLHRILMVYGENGVNFPQQSWAVGFLFPTPMYT